MKRISPKVQRAGSRLLLLLTILMSGRALAQTPDSNARSQLLREYAGSDNWYALLKNPKVWPQLQRLLGKDLPHLQENLSVSGAVDVVGGDLSVSGNAPHQGTVEEAVVCVNSYNLEVNAAVFSKGTPAEYCRVGIVL